jgi:hypothetical protein
MLGEILADSHEVIQYLSQKEAELLIMGNVLVVETIKRPKDMIFFEGSLFCCPQDRMKIDPYVGIHTHPIDTHTKTHLRLY